MLRTNYRIIETPEGFEIRKFDGDREIGLMGITNNRAKAVAICQRLMDGRYRNDWDRD